MKPSVIGSLIASMETLDELFYGYVKCLKVLSLLSFVPIYFGILKDSKMLRNFSTDFDLAPYLNKKNKL